MKMIKFYKLITKFHKKIQNILRNQVGQAAVEYSLLLGLFSSVGISINNPLIAVGIIISIIVVLSILLVWKPKFFFVAVIFLALLYAGSVYFRR
jgi:hypothetical protein